jgi:hypothetical protein
MVDPIVLQSVSYVAAAIGVLVAAVYYMMTLRITQRNMKQTLETRQAQLFMDLYRMASEREYFTAWNTFQINKGKSVEELKKVYSSDPEFRVNVTKWVWYFEGLGVLVREGLLNIRLVALLMTGLIKQWWEWWGPVAKELSVEWNWPRYVIETEYLYDELMKYIEEHPEIKT